MKYLLDTHTLLWFLFDDDKLSEKVKEIVTNSANGIFVSIITYWEISLKYGLGKLELRNSLPEELPFIAREVNILTLEISEN